MNNMKKTASAAGVALAAAALAAAFVGSAAAQDVKPSYLASPDVEPVHRHTKPSAAERPSSAAAGEAYRATELADDPPSAAAPGSASYFVPEPLMAYMTSVVMTETIAGHTNFHGH